MEEDRHKASLRIDRREIGPFMQIAAIASQRKVGGIIAAAMLPCNNMLDVKRRKRYGCLWQVAVFASLASAAANEIANSGVHHLAVRLARTMRARD